MSSQSNERFIFQRPLRFVHTFRTHICTDVVTPANIVLYHNCVFIWIGKDSAWTYYALLSWHALKPIERVEALVEDGHERLLVMKAMKGNSHREPFRTQHGFQVCGLMIHSPSTQKLQIMPVRATDLDLKFQFEFVIKIRLISLMKRHDATQ